MEIDFLGRLDGDDMINLINACIALKKDFSSRDYIEWAHVFKESYRKDVNGNNYYLVNTGQGHRVAYSYIMTDYTMKVDAKHMTYEGIEYEKSCDNFDKELRLVLTEKFGQEYVDSLFAVRFAEIEAEKRLLEESLSQGRK